MPFPRLAPAMLTLALAAAWPGLAASSEPASTPPAKPTAAKTPPEPLARAAEAAAPVDPMEQLRRRLAERLANPKASSSATSTDLLVAAKPGKTATPAPAAHAPTPATTHATAVATVATHAVTAPAAPSATPAAAAARPAASRHNGNTAAHGVVPVAAHLVSPPVHAPAAATAVPLAGGAHGSLPAQVPAAAPMAANPATAARVPARNPVRSVAKPVDAHGGAAHWDYTGPAGPQTWGGLKPEFSLCGSGQRQSPIDIRAGLAVDLEPVRFDYQSSRFSVIDNGHTVQANMAPGNAIELGGNRFELQQLHFHRPSEERIDGRQFEMSVHLVHRDNQGKLAVVTLLLEKGPAQPAVQKVWNNLPLEKNQDVPARVALDLNEMLPADQRYYTYMGSLTTPPCTEGVQWVVMRQPVTVAPEQIELFARIYPMNARPVQQASGRRILQSN